MATGVRRILNNAADSARPRHGRLLHCGCRHGRLMPTRALILRAVDRHIARADQRILVRLIALGMIGRGLIDLGRRLNR